MLLPLSQSLCESVTGSWPSCSAPSAPSLAPRYPPTPTAATAAHPYLHHLHLHGASTSPLFHSSPHGPGVTRGWEVPFCPNFLQPLCNHLNLLPNLPILRAVQNFPRHDNSPSSSHLVLFHSILLTPTAIALSSLHEGLFPVAHHSPRPNSSRAACPFLVRPFSPNPHWLPSLPRQCVVEGRQPVCPAPALLLAPASPAPGHGRNSLLSIKPSPRATRPLIGRTSLVTRQILRAPSSLLTPGDADANSAPPRPQSLVPSLIFRHQPVLHSQWVSANKFLPRTCRAIAVVGAMQESIPGLGATTNLIPTASTSGASNLQPLRFRRPTSLRRPSPAVSCASSPTLSLKCHCGRSGLWTETGQPANALPDHHAFRPDPSEQDTLPQCSTGQCRRSQQTNTSISAAGNRHQVQQPCSPRKRETASRLSQHVGCRDSSEDRPIEGHGAGRAPARDLAAV